MRLRRALFAIDPREVLYARRGFPVGAPAVQERLESVGRHFVAGYHAALEDDHPERLADRLRQIDLDLRGFAFEGAGMALALQDALLPARRRTAAFLDGPGHAFRYLVHVGVGWTMGRLPLRPAALRARLDPLLGWLTLDGYGFHETYFRTGRTVDRQAVPARLRGYERRVFDQGIGRCLWFVGCADPARIAALVDAFPAARQADLWSGVGLACTYAGGADDEAVACLTERAGPYRPALAQGAAFAAKARLAGGNPHPAMDRTTALICGLSADEAAAVTDRALVGLDQEAGPAPAYEIWRRRIQRRLGGEEEP